MSNDTTKSRDALDKAIRNAAIMRTEQVTLQAPDARALRDALSDPILAARVEGAEAARQSAEARVEALEKALEEIADLCPATQEVCLASTMGQIAIAALSSQGAEDGK